MTLYCGIDHGKLKSNFCIIDDKQKVLDESKLANDLPLILKYLKRFKRRGPIKIVIESTQTWYWLVDGLRDANYEVTLAHPLKLHMITSAKVKTDRRDAKMLALMLKGNFIPEAYICPPEIRSIRDMIRYRVDLVHKRSREFVDLHLVLAKAGHVSYSRNEIIKLDNVDLQSLIDDPLVRLHGQQNLERIMNLTQQIDEVEQVIAHKSGQIPEIAKLSEIPGIGKILSATIFYEISDINRFKNAKRFSSYCRVVPGVAQSGAVTRRGRGSKQGNRYLKAAFSQAAVRAVQFCSTIKDYYEYHRRKHSGSSGKLVCYNIISHKLAIAVFQILKNKRAYDPSSLFSGPEIVALSGD